MLYVSKTIWMISFVLNVEISSRTQEVPMTVNSFKFIFNLQIQKFHTVNAIIRCLRVEYSEVLINKSAAQKVI